MTIADDHGIENLCGPVCEFDEPLGVVDWRNPRDFGIELNFGYELMMACVGLKISRDGGGSRIVALMLGNELALKWKIQKGH